MSECRSCHARIAWVVVEATGRRMPVDFAPSPKGNVVGADGGSRFTADGCMVVVVHAGPVPGGRLSHFATCPHAAAHRR